MSGFKIFQFHKGTIKTVQENDTLNIYHNFNSIKVRLKPRQHTLTRIASRISIP